MLLRVLSSSALAAVAVAATVAPVATAAAATGHPTPKPAVRHLRPRPTPTTPTPTTPTPTTASASGGAGAFLHMTSPDYADIARADQVVLQQHQYGRIAAIRAARPGVKIYFYSNAQAVSLAAGNGAYQPSVVTTPQLQANPSWVLRDAAGQPTRWADYGYLQPFDQGNPALQKAAVTNLKAELAAHDWDGVMLDDVNIDTTGHAWSAAPATYTGGSTYAAMSSFLKAVTPAIRATGKEVAVNMQTRWNDWTRPVTEWTPLVDVVNLEHCTTWSEDTPKATDAYLWGLDATWRYDEMTRIQALGGRVWCHDYAAPTDVRAQKYSRALFLMAWDGVSRSASMWTPASWTGTWYTPQTSLDLGQPTGRATVPVKNVYARTFAKGVLYLNTSKADVTVQTPTGAATVPALSTLVR